MKMGRIRQGLAALLCAAMLFTMDGGSIQAALVSGQGTAIAADQSAAEENTTETAISTESVENSSTENTEEAVQSTEIASTEIAAADTESSEAISSESQNTEAPSSEAPAEDTENAEILAKQQAVQANVLLSYLVFGSDYVETPGEQYALIGIGDGTYDLSSAILHYKNDTTGAEYSVAADTIDTDSALFYMNFPDTSFAGSYRVTSIDYVADGVSGTIQISDTGISARFGVDTTVTTEPDAETVSDESGEGDISITDENGNMISSDNIGEVLDKIGETEGSSDGVSSTGAGDVVIVLDAGHGGTDSGTKAEYDGVMYYERDLVLKIATYCKEELEQYSGVKVYMTPRVNSAGGPSSRQDRALYAKSVGANLLLSFHLNAGGTATGAEIYYPNSNYNSTVGAIGQGIAAKIQSKLIAMGLTDRGIKIKEYGDDGGNNGLYPDGSMSDYNGIQYWSKLYGFTGVLVEHAFLSSGSDFYNYLNTDDKLKALGVADATGVAEYYGLSKTSATPTWNYITSASSTSLKLAWKQTSGANGYYIYRSTSKSGTYSKIATISSGSTLTYTDKSLTAGKNYYYKIQYYTNSGVSNDSSVLKAYPVKTTSIASVKSNGSGKLKVTWNQGSGAAGYLLYRSDSKNGSYKRVAAIASGATLSYTDTGLTAGKTYYYKVRVGVVQNKKQGYSDASAAAGGWSIAATKITGINATDTGDLAVKWNSVKNAYQYQIYRSTSKSGTYTRLATVKTNTYTDTTVSANKKYYYKIRVLNVTDGSKGVSDYSSIKYGIQIGKTAISYVQSASSTSLKLAWKTVSGATGYTVYRSNSKNGTYTAIKIIDSGSVISYTDKKLQTGKTYYYKIQANNKVGSYVGCSEYSKVASGKTATKTAVSYVQSYSSTSLKIAWKKVDGAIGYKIARSTSEKGTYTVIKEITSGTTTTFKDNSVKTGKNYYYKIETLNSNSGKTGYSGYSSVVAGKTVNPTKITQTKAVSTQAIQITWSKVSGAAGYQIYRSTSSSGSYEKVGNVNSGSTVTYKDTPPKTNTTYYYKVRSLNSNNGKTGYSQFCTAVSGKSVAVPTKLTVSLTNDGKLQLNWKKVSGAISYRIYRMESNGAGYSKLTDIESGSTVTYTDADVKSGVTYTYAVLAYNKVNGVTGYSGKSAGQSYTISYYEIMGETTVKVAQMVACYNATGHAYPSSVYESYGAGDIATFATIVCQEAEAEGVKAEVLWAQIMLETGWLQFSGSMVKPEQCNFGGLGALDNSGGSYVATFPDVRTGIRAQVQHLKAYASTDVLNNTLVDTRFSLVKRGCAIYVEWLGQQENPLGYGWATGADYGNKIMRLVNLTKSYSY